MNQSMKDDINSLASCPDMIWAKIVGSQLSSTSLHISLSRTFSQRTVIELSQQNSNIPAEITLSIRADTKSVYDHIKGWAETCHKDHPECGNLNWSTRNPTRLLQIISPSEIQLVDAGEDMGLVDYVALSYCWGSPGDVAVQRGRTVDENLPTRKAQPFATCELPATIRDAITLTRGCGLRYIWIDSVCIIQDNGKDWLAEAHRMHEVYANAYFTLCAVSIDTASAGLFHARDAWRYRAERCQLASHQITSRSASCRELVDGSTWSSRGWTLQEEHLSPRIIYWTPQRVYWSCGRCSVGEGDLSSTTTAARAGRLLEQHVTTSTISMSTHSSSSFLAASRSGKDIHEKWYDLVESFTKRKLSNAGDKLAAIAGIAMRYQHCRGAGDQYLAGLWMDTLAQDLAWKTPVYLIENNNDPSLDEAGNNLIPSWSWASLPLGHPALMRRRREGSHDDEGARNDQFIEPLLLQTKEENTTVSAPMSGSIVVAGRMRPLIRSPHSQRVDWSDISVGNTQEQDEKFSFLHHIATDVHSVDISRGLVLVYEAHREETLGYIDYLTDADRVYRGVANLECLELGKSEMLLLERCLDDDIEEEAAAEDDDDEGRSREIRSYRRVGVSWKFRKDFFERAERVRIELV